MSAFFFSLAPIDGARLFCALDMGTAEERL